MFTARVLTKWSEIIPVCGIIVVKRKITAKIGGDFSIHGGPDRDRTGDLQIADLALSQTELRAQRLPRYYTTNIKIVKNFISS